MFAAIPVAGSTPGSDCAALVDRIGTQGFLPALLGVCRVLAGASDLAVLRQGDGTPELLGTCSDHGDGALRAGRRYLHEGYYRLDANTRLARRGQPLSISHLRVDELPDSGYRAACYEGAGVDERISLLVPAGDAWLFVNAYRPPHCAVPHPGAIERLAAQAPLVAAALRRHLALCEAPADPLAALSARERDVVQAIVSGESAKQAGQRLGLCPTSVATYRQRAYAKLGVRRQAELFRLLGATAG